MNLRLFPARILPALLLLTLLAPLAPASGQTVTSDDFSSGTYTGGSGNWVGGWADINEKTDETKGDIRIWSDGGDNRLRVKDNDKGAYREVDLSGFNTATLAFDYRRQGLDSGSDAVSVEISADGGASWTPLDTFAGPATDGSYTGVSYDISAYLAANTRIRFFSSSTLGNNDIVYFDNIVITAIANTPPVAVDDAATTTAGAPVVIDVLANDTDAENNWTLGGKSLAGTNALLAGNGDDLYIPFTPENSGTLGDLRPDGQPIGLTADTATLTDDDTSTGSVSYIYTFDNGSPFLPDYYFDPATGELVLLFNDIDFKPTLFPDIFGGGLDLTFKETLALTFLANASDTPGPVDLVLDETNYGNYRADGFGETNNVTAEYRLHLRDDLGVTQAEFDDLNADGEFAFYVTFSVILTTVDLDPGATNTTTVSNSPESMTDAFVAEGSCFAVPSVSVAPGNGTVTLDGATGTLTYTPDPGFSGVDTFTYRICDAAGACDTAVVTVTVNAQIDLSLAMTVDEPAPATNTDVTFTLTLTNAGPSVATGVTVTDVLPDSLTFVSSVPAQGTYAGGVWTVGSLAAGGTTTLTLMYTVTAVNTPQTLVAEVSAANEPDVDSTPGNGDPAEDDRDSATVSPTGTSGGGDGGLESNGTLARTLAQTLYARRQVRQRTPERAPRPYPFEPGLAAKTADLTSLIALIPATGPRASQALVVSPEDLLPVTNATGVFAVDYVRFDGRRLAALFATTTPAGEIYEHTKVVCDRLRGATLEAVRHLDIDGHPFVLSELRQADGSVDEAVSFVVYRQGSAFVVDSRFRHDEYRPPQQPGDVFNFQVWSLSKDYTADLVRQVLAALAAEGPVTFVNTSDAPPALPRVFVRAGQYAQGHLTLSVYNAAGAGRLRLSGGTLSRTEGGTRETFEKELLLPRPGPGAPPVVSVTVPVGPVYDAAFFVEADGSPGKDQLYLADGAWGYAADEATVEAFSLTPQDGESLEVPGRWTVERSAHLQGRVTTWSVLFRYLQSNGRPLDLSAYQYVEFTARGQGQVQLLLEKASIATADQFGAVFRLTPEPRTHRFWFRDLRLPDGTGRFTADNLKVLSFYVYGDQAHDAPFDLYVSDVRFGGAEGDLLAEVPDAYILEPNYPNPFNPTTNITFALPEGGPVRLEVFDLLGRRVAVLADTPFDAGRHTLPFEARGLASGVYVYRLTAGGRAFTRTMMLLK